VAERTPEADGHTPLRRGGWGSAAMSDAKWWMDAGSKWHQGLPPPGWCQAPDGRWHPPGSDDTTDEMTVTSADGGAHLRAGGWRGSLWQTYRTWPQWARLAAPIAILVLTVGVLTAAATGGLLNDDEGTTAADLAAPATTVASASGGTARSTTTPTDAATTASVPSTTAPAQGEPVPTTAPEPPPPTTGTTDNDFHPGGRCSPEGATSVSSDGIPLTCTTQKCRGAPFPELRWRRTAC
jgi:hypothetical protein